jgi:outer membrane protein assembly factor BamA
LPRLIARKETIEHHNINSNSVNIRQRYRVKPRYLMALRCQMFKRSYQSVVVNTAIPFGNVAYLHRIEYVPDLAFSTSMIAYRAASMA